MFQDAYTKLDQAECKKILAEIGPALVGSPFDADTVTIMKRALSFYPGYHFLDIADYETMPPRHRFVIYKPDDVVVLDWTNEPLYILNRKIPILLDKDTVLDYARFFFSVVRGPHGKFSLVENIDDIDWSDEPPPAARKAIGKILQPLTLKGKQADDGIFCLRAGLIFKTVLYQANIFVSPKGAVSVADEEILIDDLPLLDDRLGQ